MTDISTKLELIALAAIPVIFAIIFHEIAHGWMASRLGDNTARDLGRLSPNPLKHIDPVGTILVPVVMVLLLGFAFGWAKPVPINWKNLQNPRRDMVKIAVAGPTANLAMALFWGLCMKIATLMPDSLQSVSHIVLEMAYIGVIINTILMVFNMIPIPPLDGGRVAVGLLPAAIANPLARVEPFGILIIVILLMSKVIVPVIKPILNASLTIISILFGLN